MSRQFTVILKNEDLSTIDISMAIQDYADELLNAGEIEEYLKFEVIEMD